MRYPHFMDILSSNKDFGCYPDTSGQRQAVPQFMYSRVERVFHNSEIGYPPSHPPAAPHEWPMAGQLPVSQAAPIDEFRVLWTSVCTSPDGSAATNEDVSGYSKRSRSSKSGKMVSPLDVC